MSQNTPLLTPSRRHTAVWTGIAAAPGLVPWLPRPMLAPFPPGGLIACLRQAGAAWRVRRRVPHVLVAPAALATMRLFAAAATMPVVLLRAVIGKRGPRLKQQMPARIAHVHAPLAFGQSFGFFGVPLSPPASAIVPSARRGSPASAPYRN